MLCPEPDGHGAANMETSCGDIARADGFCMECAGDLRNWRDSACKTRVLFDGTIVPIMVGAITYLMLSFIPMCAYQKDGKM
jgi:hypothetical protein